MTLKDLIENSDQRYWDAPKDVELDPDMAQLVARSKPTGKEGQDRVIERAKRSIEDELSKRMAADPTIGHRHDFGTFHGPEIRIRRFKLLCSACEHTVSIPYTIPLDRLEAVAKGCLPCKCGAEGSWTIQEVV